MNAKRIVLFGICTALLFSLAACSIGNNSASNHGGAQSTDNNGENSSQSNVDYTPVDRPTFDTMSEVKSFLDATSDGTTGHISQHVSQSDAATISSTAGTLLYPVLAISSDEAGFNAQWFNDRTSMDIIYVIDSIQYRFIYFFGSDYEWESDEEPTVQDMMLGTYSVDFWPREHVNFDVQFYGFVKLEDVYITITVTGNEIEAPSFEAFDFVSLSSID